MTHDDYERLYREPLAGLPVGNTVGEFRGFVADGGARRPAVRALDSALFVWPRWGIDFRTERWWFVRPGLQLGHFRLARGPSRWRDAEVFQVHYDVSRLPLRGVLYDEVKPLEDGRVIGLGGVNRERGVGEHFWFELSPL